MDIDIPRALCIMMEGSTLLKAGRMASRCALVVYFELSLLLGLPSALPSCQDFLLYMLANGFLAL